MDARTIALVLGVLAAAPAGPSDVPRSYEDYWLGRLSALKGTEFEQEAHQCLSLPPRPASCWDRYAARVLGMAESGPTPLPADGGVHTWSAPQSTICMWPATIQDCQKACGNGGNSMRAFKTGINNVECVCAR